MTCFEQAFGDAERAADSTLKSAAEVASLTRKIQKAATVGDIAAMKRAHGRLDDALDTLRQAVANTVASWPFRDEEEARYLRDHYADELRLAAVEMDLDIHERDGQLISHPSIVRILPDERAVRVDRKKVSAIRPSHLAGLLLGNQKKRSRYRSDSFMESLHHVYSEIVRDESSGGLMPGTGRVVPLDRIYKLLTALPGVGRDYDRTDFARDLYNLQANGPKRTKKGADVSFSFSSGTKGQSKLFTFVGPDGQTVNYYGVRFTEGS